MPATRVHLVRHGEVNNPDRILYGRLDGFGLTDRGHHMAAQLGEFFADNPVSRVVASPLLRAQQTATPIAEVSGVELDVDDRVIEGTNIFQGTRVSRKTLLQRPSVWPKLVNPWKPSWGEPYRAIVQRMLEAMDSAWDSVDSGEVVIVSHQLPIWMVHRHVAGQPLPHSPQARRCTLGSVTSFEKTNTDWREVSYAEPVAGLLEGAVDLGAV
mgnify:CR=1 FL=1